MKEKYNLKNYIYTYIHMYMRALKYLFNWMKVNTKHIHSLTHATRVNGRVSSSGRLASNAANSHRACDHLTTWLNEQSNKRSTVIHLYINIYICIYIYTYKHTYTYRRYNRLWNGFNCCPCSVAAYRVPIGIKICIFHLSHF